MISAVAAHARPASCAASTNPLAELVTDTKLIFDLIRRRKALLVRAFTVSEVAQLREEHSQLLQQERQLVEKHFVIQHGYGGSLRRLAELDEQPGHPTGRSASEFLGRLDQLIQEVLQHDPIETGKFLQQVFDYYQQGCIRKISSLQPPSPVKPYRSIKVDTASTIGPLSPLLSPARGMIRVLSCNERLMKCWNTEGRRNYQPLEIDPTLKEIYFFTRTQECNATLMYEEMMERNKETQFSVQAYERQYKRYQCWARFQNRQTRRYTRKEVETTETKQRSKSKSKMALLTKQEQKSRSKESPQKTNFGRTMFRIRAGPERPSKLSEPTNLLNETFVQFGRGPYRQSRPLNTIRIEFKSIRDISRG